MERDITNSLLAWKNQAGKKPLVLKGARQVGKTYSLEEFGTKYYRETGHNYHYIDLREARKLHGIFEEHYDPGEILRFLQFEQRITIDSEHDLLILDEIQACPHAITSLKYFEQDMAQLDVIAAGSHLGLQNQDVAFPVGKVSFLYMYPMTYDEFVRAVDRGAYELYRECSLEAKVPRVVHERLLELLRAYVFTGGLPEAVSTYRELRNDTPSELAQVRRVQQELVTGYQADFAKYAGVVNAAHIQSVFDSIPYQLSVVHDETTRKFRFADVLRNRKGFESVRGPLRWLREARLCIQCPIAKKAGHPLKSYTQENRFKVFLFDTGILNCMLGLPPEVIVGENVGSYKGYMMENFVAQELLARIDQPPYTWQEGTAEIEFLTISGAEIVPLEVKSSRRSRRSKSLDVYVGRYHPARAYKLTAQNYGHDNSRGITTLPLYAVGRLIEEKERP